MRYLPLIVISVLCFLASLTVHILGWMQIVPPGGQTVMFLHVFIFVLFIPLFFLLKRPEDKKTAIDEFLKQLPKWPLRLTQFLFFYAIAHFIFFIYQTSHYPKNGVPTYLQIRGFSGHWMVFYVICALGYAELRRRLIENNKADVRAA